MFTLIYHILEVFTKRLSKSSVIHMRKWKESKKTRVSQLNVIFELYLRILENFLFDFSLNEIHVKQNDYNPD